MNTAGASGPGPSHVPCFGCRRPKRGCTLGAAAGIQAPSKQAALLPATRMTQTVEQTRQLRGCRPLTPCQAITPHPQEPPAPGCRPLLPAFILLPWRAARPRASHFRCCARPLVRGPAARPEACHSLRLAAARACLSRHLACLLRLGLLGCVGCLLALVQVVGGALDPLVVVLGCARLRCQGWWWLGGWWW